MAHAAFTLRLPAEERLALEDLSRIEGRPMNQLLNEAVRIYLQRRGKRETGLTQSLERLHAYRQRDPQFQNALESVVEAEVTGTDPVEGTVLSPKATTRSSSSQQSSLQNHLRDLLRA